MSSPNPGRHKGLTPQGQLELEEMLQALAPRAEPATDEEKRQEALRRAELLQESRKAAEKYRKRHLARRRKQRA